jgi:ketosteroid isomerase-like protein
MSQENVEIVRRIYSLGADAAGVVRGDYDDAFREYFDRDHELLPPSAYPDIELSYRGVAGWRQWFGQMDEIWHDFRTEPERFFDAGARVVVFVRVSGKAKGGGPALAISSAHVLTLRDGKVTRTDVFLDRAEALDVVGLWD